MNYSPIEAGFDDDLGAGAAVQTASAFPAAKPAEGDLVTGEVAGDAPVAAPSPTESGAEAGAHDEIENFAGAESGEEFAEATPAQLASTPAESAASDMEGIEGYVPPTATEAAEAMEAGEMPEAGTALDGAESGAEPEFAFLAALVPTLVSAVGPSVAKAIAGRLRPKTLARVRKVAATVKPGVQAAAGKNNILALLAKLLGSAESMPSTESGGAVDESVVATAVAAFESIIGDDDRVRINATTDLPWRRICALRITFKNGRVYRGTGFLIGPRAVATAGHCVYLKSEGGWAKSIEVSPGASGTARPFGSSTSTQFRSVKGWVDGGRPESDYGCVVLQQGAFGGRNLGAFGFAAWSPAELVAAPAVVAGYPGDKPFAELWGMSRKLKSVSSEQVTYDIDTMGGQSGAPVYIKRNGQRYCVAIHNYGGAKVNSATRITQSVYQRLAAWRQL